MTITLLTNVMTQLALGATPNGDTSIEVLEKKAQEMADNQLLKQQNEFAEQRSKLLADWINARFKMPKELAELKSELALAKANRKFLFEAESSRPDKLKEMVDTIVHATLAFGVATSIASDFGAIALGLASKYRGGMESSQEVRRKVGEMLGSEGLSGKGGCDAANSYVKSVRRKDWKWVGIATVLGALYYLKGDDSEKGRIARPESFIKNADSENKSNQEENGPSKSSDELKKYEAELAELETRLKDPKNIAAVRAELDEKIKASGSERTQLEAELMTEYKNILSAHPKFNNVPIDTIDADQLMAEANALVAEKSNHLVSDVGLDGQIYDVIGLAVGFTLGTKVGHIFSALMPWHGYAENIRDMINTAAVAEFDRIKGVCEAEAAAKETAANEAAAAEVSEAGDVAPSAAETEKLLYGKNLSEVPSVAYESENATESINFTPNPVQITAVKSAYSSMMCMAKDAGSAIRAATNNAFYASPALQSAGSVTAVAENSANVLMRSSETGSAATAARNAAETAKGLTSISKTGSISEGVLAGATRVASTSLAVIFSADMVLDLFRNDYDRSVSNRLWDQLFTAEEMQKAVSGDYNGLSVDLLTEGVRNYTLPGVLDVVAAKSHWGLKTMIEQKDAENAARSAHFLKTTIPVLVREGIPTQSGAVKGALAAVEIFRAIESNEPVTLTPEHARILAQYQEMGRNAEAFRKLSPGQKIAFEQNVLMHALYQSAKTVSEVETEWAWTIPGSSVLDNMEVADWATIYFKDDQLKEPGMRRRLLKSILTKEELRAVYEEARQMEMDAKDNWVFCRRRTPMRSVKGVQKLVWNDNTSCREYEKLGSDMSRMMEKEETEDVKVEFNEEQPKFIGLPTLI